jgi:hypothetical protein
VQVSPPPFGLAKSGAPATFTPSSSCHAIRVPSGEYETSFGWPAVARKHFISVAPPSVPSPDANAIPNVSWNEYSSAICLTPGWTSAAQNRAPALPGSIQPVRMPRTLAARGSPVVRGTPINP